MRIRREKQNVWKLSRRTIRIWATKGGTFRFVFLNSIPDFAAHFNSFGLGVHGNGDADVFEW